MGGIIGYVGRRQAAPILLEGLARLGYRGYDSAGIAVLRPDGVFSVQKAVGKLEVLRGAMEGGLPSGSLGLGHTRWATHGPPTLFNTHPHTDCTESAVVVQNGIVENYLTIKQELQSRGHVFRSQTDTEVIPHLIEEALTKGLDLEGAVREMLTKAHGALALLIAARGEPQTMVAVRSGNAGGLLVSQEEDEAFVASDLPALLPLSRNAAFLSSGEMAVVTPQETRFSTIAGGRPITKRMVVVSQDPTTAVKGGYKHFMLKEIMDQPEALTDALRGRVDLESPSLSLAELAPLADRLDCVRRVILAACGSSHHAALVGRHYIETMTGLPVQVEVSSELRNHDIPLGPDVLLVSVTQSGETADTLAIMEQARRCGALQVAVTNTLGSQATRIADATLDLRAGLEVAVAATKTFTSTVLCLYLLALHLGDRMQRLTADALATRLRDLARLPYLVSGLLEDSSTLDALATRYSRRQNILYMGRGILHPIALEGALKLTEISYVHAQGFPAGEMRHGPLALVEEAVPVIALAPRTALRAKMSGSIEEVRARGGPVIGVLTEGDAELAARVDQAVFIPDAPEALLPILTVAPLQLFAYFVGMRRGADVDQPRNLSKSVIVE
jgi:glucosamine--fructose-6-phosphate aminotransferase (isomerizing)